MQRGLRVSIVLALLAASGAAQADATLSYRGATEACHAEFEKISVSGSRIRIDSAILGMQASSIYDGLEQLLVGLDHRARTYTQMELDDDAQEFQGDVASALGTRSQKEMEKAKEAMAAAREQYEAQCAKSRQPCPAMAQFDMAEGMLSGDYANIDMDAMLAMQEQNLAQVDPKMLERSGIDVKEMKAQLAESRARIAEQQRQQSAVNTVTGETRTVAGITCAVSEKRIEGVLVETRCEADPGAIPLDEKDAVRFQRGVARLTKMAETWRPLGEKVTGQKIGDDRTGILVEQTCYDERGEVAANVVLQVAKGGVAPDAFDVPAGYKPAGMLDSSEDE